VVGASLIGPTPSKKRTTRISGMLRDSADCCRGCASSSLAPFPFYPGYAVPSQPPRPNELFPAVEGPPDIPALPPVVSTARLDIEGFRLTMREVGAEDAVDGILDLFVQNVPERIAALTAAVKARDASEIARAAHAFKSPAGAIGALGLASLLQEVELAATQGAVDQACAAFAQVGPETDAVVRYLRAQTGEQRNG
jgi:HPt (histidine-containing phosphotransfer) domain-containing protein